MLTHARACVYVCVCAYTHTYTHTYMLCIHALMSGPYKNSKYNLNIDKKKMNMDKDVFLYDRSSQIKSSHHIVK